MKKTPAEDDTARPSCREIRWCLGETSVEQEIITFSELIFYYYSVIVDRLTIVANFMHEEYVEGKKPLDRNVYEYMMDMTRDLLEIFEAENPFNGTLVRTAVTDALGSDNGTDERALERAFALIPVLREIVFFQGQAVQVLDDLRHGVPLDFEKKVQRASQDAGHPDRLHGGIDDDPILLPLPRRVLQIPSSELH